MAAKRDPRAAAQERERRTNIPTSMKKTDLPSYERKEELERLAREARAAAEDIVATIRVLRQKASYRAMKGRARERMNRLYTRLLPFAIFVPAFAVGWLLVKRLRRR